MIPSFIILILIFSLNSNIQSRDLFPNKVRNEILDPTSMPSNCESKQEHILFLKTHKCGSTSIQNILFRYGDNHNLYFVLSKGKRISLNYYEGFNSHKLFHPIRLMNRLNVNYSILTHHTRIKEWKQVEKIMPKDTIRITILRDPVSAFKSFFDYYRYGDRWSGVKKGTSFKKFLRIIDDSEGYTKTFPQYGNITYETYGRRMKKFDKNRRVSGGMGRNSMSHDLGFQIQNFESNKSIHEFIRMIDEKYKLVMILERMDESLILLRYLLCWSLDDIVSFHHNSRIEKLKQIKISEKEKFVIKKFNHADYVLYEYFLKKFNSIVESFGREKMKQEVEALKKLRKKYYNICVKEVKRMEDVQPKGYWFSPFVTAFDIKNEMKSNLTCIQMTLTETMYTARLKRKQKMMMQSIKLGLEPDFDRFNNNFIEEFFATKN